MGFFLADERGNPPPESVAHPGDIRLPIEETFGVAALKEAAEGLGAGAWRRFFKVTLPLVFPAISAGALLTFVLSIADFGTPAPPADNRSM